VFQLDHVGAPAADDDDDDEPPQYVGARPRVLRDRRTRFRASDTVRQLDRRGAQRAGARAARNRSTGVAAVRRRARQHDAARAAVGADRSRAAASRPSAANASWLACAAKPVENFANTDQTLAPDQASLEAAPFVSATTALGVLLFLVVLALVIALVVLAVKNRRLRAVAQAAEARAASAPPPSTSQRRRSRRSKRPASPMV
jgi:hypothetical protein